jgi:hypothetical protein
VALIGTNVSEKLISSIIKVERISELGTALATLMTEAKRSSETLVLMRATRRHTPENDSLQFKAVDPVHYGNGVRQANSFLGCSSHQERDDSDHRSLG